MFMVPRKDMAASAHQLAVLHENHATTLSREFDWLFRTSLHKLPQVLAPQ
jgi:hypothetical protein